MKFFQVRNSVELICLRKLLIDVNLYLKIGCIFAPTYSWVAKFVKLSRQRVFSPSVEKRRTKLKTRTRLGTN